LPVQPQFTGAPAPDVQNIIPGKADLREESWGESRHEVKLIRKDEHGAARRYGGTVEERIFEEYTRLPALGASLVNFANSPWGTHSRSLI